MYTKIVGTSLLALGLVMMVFTTRSAYAQTNTFPSTGFVGIGTLSPIDSIHVATANATLFLQDTYNTASAGINSAVAFADKTSTQIGFIGFGGFNHMVVWNNSNTDLAFATNSTEHMRLTAAGNLGVGTTNPGAALDVHGHVANSGGAATVASCGAGANMVGNDTKGIVTIGTGGITSCVVTFNSSFTTTPACVVTWTGSAVQSAVITANPGTANLTLYFSASVPYGSFAYHCMQ